MESQKEVRLIINPTLSEKIKGVLIFLILGVLVIWIIFFVLRAMLSNRTVEYAYAVGAGAALFAIAKPLFERGQRLFQKTDLEKVLAMLKDSKWKNRKWAVNKLTNIKWSASTDEENINYLIAANKWDEIVTFGSKATKSIIESLKWEEKYLPPILTALKKIKDPSTIKPLIELLNDKTVTYLYKKDISNTLKELSGQDFGKNYDLWLAWWQKQSSTEKK